MLVRYLIMHQVSEKLIWSLEIGQSIDRLK